MKRFVAGIVSAALMAGIVSGFAPAADAATGPGGQVNCSGPTTATLNQPLQSTWTLSPAAGYEISSGSFLIVRGSGIAATVTPTSGSGAATGSISLTPTQTGTITVTCTFVFNPADPTSGLSAAASSASFSVQVSDRPSITSCTLSFSGTTGTARWTTSGAGFDGFEFGAPGGTTLNAGPNDSSVQFEMGTLPSGHKVYVVDPIISGTGGIPSLCEGDYTQPAPGQPAFVGPVRGYLGGAVTVNYSIGAPTSVVQGIEYQLDGTGGWIRPGGTAPTGGAGGSFSLSSVPAGDHTIVLRSLGYDPSSTPSMSSPAAFTVPAPAPMKPSGTTARPSQGTSSPAIGSTSTKPVAAPPAQPVSSVAGTSNGVGAGTNGALAANTGDAGIDAPCLAKNGTLFPNLYSTVGSQLTMAPNTTGMADPTSFIVSSGALPPGIQLDRMFGVLFGVATQAGSWVTTVQATFPDGTTRSSQFTTRIDADSQTLQYAALNVGVLGSQLSIVPTTNAPAVGTTYRLVCGKLPAGMQLDPRTGSITGTPTEKLLLPTPMRVAETSVTGKAAASFLLIVDTVAAYESISYPAHPHLRVGRTARISPTVVGMGEIVKFRVSKGKLPRGLRLNPTTGVITGRPKSAGPAHTITIVAQTKGGALISANPMRIFVRR